MNFGSCTKFWFCSTPTNWMFYVCTTCMLSVVCARPIGVVWETKWRFHSILAVAKMPNPTLLQNKSQQHCFCLSICQFFFTKTLNLHSNISTLWIFICINWSNFLYYTEHTYILDKLYSAVRSTLCATSVHDTLIIARFQ